MNSHSGKLKCDVNLTAFTEQGDKGTLHNEEFPAFLLPPHQMSPGWSNQEESDGWSTWYIRYGQEWCIYSSGEGGGDIKRQLVRPWHRWEGNTAKKSAGRAWTAFISLRIRTSGGFL